MRSVKNEINLNQKRILLRLDLNVPLNNGKITDTTRNVTTLKIPYEFMPK